MSEPQEERPRSSTTAIFDRVHRVEGELAEVREMLAGLTVNVQGLAQSVAKIGTTLDARSGTDWKALAAWASVIIGIVGLGGVLILQPLRGQVDSIGASVDRLEEYRILDARSQLQNAQTQVADAERSGRYLERVDRHEIEIAELHKRLQLSQP